MGSGTVGGWVGSGTVGGWVGRGGWRVVGGSGG